MNIFEKLKEMAEELGKLDEVIWSMIDCLTIRVAIEILQEELE